MVYNGPSKGCVGCLKRRVKCDEVKPSCRRCQKAGRECSYRDPARIRIRDMTATTIYRFESDVSTTKLAETSRNRDRSHSKTTVIPVSGMLSPATSPILIEVLPHQRGTWICREALKDAAQTNHDFGSDWHRKDFTEIRKFGSPDLYRTPYVSVEHQARTYLVNSYLNVTYNALDPGYLNILKLSLGRNGGGRCLDTSLLTLALAAFSRRPNSRTVTIDAQRAYSLALKTINTELGKAGSIFNDELLASIVILALVETLISNKFTGFCNHIEGAWAIVRYRGSRKFDDELGAELFLLLRYETIRSTVIRWFEPQDQFTHHWAMSQMELVNNPCLATAYKILATRKKDCIYTPVFRTLDAFMNLNQAGNTPFLPSAFMTPSVMDTIMSEEAELSNLFPDYLKSVGGMFSLMDLPDIPIKEFQPMPCVWASPFPWSDANEGQQRVMGYTWKSLPHASLAIFLCTVHLHSCSVAARFTQRMKPLSNFETSTEYQIMVERALKSVDIIVGSVPFLLNMEREDEAHRNTLEPTGNHGIEFSWPFFFPPFLTVLESPYATETQRERLISAIRYIGVEKGVKQAEAYLHGLESQDEDSGH